MTSHCIRIVPLPPPSPLNLGIGVTARSEDDARALVAADYGDAAKIAELTPIRSVDDLDQHHVVPNMGNTFARGMWFPRGVEADAVR